jgi:hypothetical protein
MSSAFEGEAVKNIADLAQRKPVEIGGLIVRPDDWVAEDPNGLYKPEPAHPAPKAAVLKVATLGALRDYLKANRDELKRESLLVHIETPNRVTVGSALRSPARDRELYITAEAEDMTGGFVGKYQSCEDFNIGLQVRFVDVDQRASLLQAVSSVRIQQSAEAIDDGISQTVEARAGAVLKSHQTLPNPVQLTPFRTFRDILQPSSPFVLRAQVVEGKLPNLALLEADGSTWKLTAIERVRDWLKLELDGLDIAILA